MGNRAEESKRAATAICLERRGWRTAAVGRIAAVRRRVLCGSSRCIAVGGHSARGCDPNRPIGRGATRRQVSGTARTSRALLTGLRRIADVHQARQRGVRSGSTWMSAVRIGGHTLSTQSRYRPCRIGRPEADLGPAEQLAAVSAAWQPVAEPRELSLRRNTSPPTAFLLPCGPTDMRGA
jgi:hypothetical protein